jgi:hypothetical protein
MRVRRPLLILVAATAVACGSKAATIAVSPTPVPHGSQPAANATATPPAAPSVPYRVWIVGDGTPDSAVTIVDAAARKAAITMPDGVFSPDFSRLYTVTQAPGGWALNVIDGHTGALLHSQVFDVNYSLPYVGIQRRGLSPDGHWLVLDGTDRSGAPQVTTTLVVVDTTYASTPRRVILSGDFLFDGISNSGRNLYLLENLGQGATGGIAYHVRRYDMSASQLDPTVIVDKQSPSEVTMSGIAIAHVNSADGTWQYTVYAFGERGPVVHALDLEHGVAACIDLPTGNNGTTKNQELELLWSLALDTAHNRLYAVNGALGSIAVIDTSGWPNLARQATVTPASTPQATPATFFGSFGGVVDAQAKRTVLGGARLSPDGATLYSVADASVLVIDTATLRMQRELFAGRAVFGMALSPDGRFLWAAADGDLLQLDLAGGGGPARQVGPAHVSGVLRVEPVTP